MEEINHNLSSDLLENEKFDFDLPFSPNINQDEINEHQELDDEEVFFGPVGFTEQCVATRAKALQQENDIKPLSPLTGEQVVEVFKEATKLALQFEKLSSNPSPVSSLSSNNSSILKLSSTASESPSWLTGKLSSDSSEGTSFSQIELDFDKENIQPLSVDNGDNFSSDKNRQIPFALNSKQVPRAMKEENIISFTNYTNGKIEQNEGNFDKEGISLGENENHKSAKLGEHIISDLIKKTAQQSDNCKDDPKQFSTEEHLNEAKNGRGNLKISGRESEQLYGEKVVKREGIVQQDAMHNGTKSNKIPVVKARGSGLPVRPGLKTSKLPKTKNMGKSMSAFSLPISSIGSGKKRDVSTKSADVAEKNACPTDQPSTGAINSSNSKMRKSVPAKAPQDASKIKPKSEKALAKRNIFNSSEASEKLATKDCKSKLPVSGSHIPASRPRRRRSISLSSLDSSQSSASSQTSQDDTTTSKPMTSQHDVASKLIRPSTKIPTTKASLATRRCKLQDTTADKKPQALKALPRPGFTSSNKNSKTDTKAAKAMPPPSTEQDLKEDKTPMPATPRSSSSLPVTRRRSSFKSSLSSTSSREGSPPKYFTPSKPGGKMTEPKTASSTCRRRSSNPTPRSNAPSSASRRVLKSSGDESVLLPLSSTSKPKSTKKTNRKLIPDSDSSSANDACFLAQNVDDLLGCDTEDSIFEGFVPIQPRPISQVDLIDLSGL